MKKFALIVASGSGKRMENLIPKQFLEVAGKPVLMHAIEVFYNFDNQIDLIIVLPENQIAFWNELCLKHNFSIGHRVAIGGEQRFFSVKNGLSLIDNDGIVFIHDGVRPLVGHETIQRCIDTAILYGNAIPVMPVKESVRWLEMGRNKPIDRNKLFLVQTPQTFKVSLIQRAYDQSFDECFTDDASVLGKSGHEIQLVEGNRENIKITWPEDLEMAELYLQKQKNYLRQ